jgi:prepilin-type N-terminal cleavage/methylation domain-containing protein
MRNRRGFTLIEVMVALVILTVVALSLGRFVGNFSHAVGTSTVRTVATAVAAEQLEIIRASGNTTASYPTLVANFNGITVTGFPGYPNMVRTNRVVRTQTVGPVADYTTITVTVTEPTMTTSGTAVVPVALTVVVAAP